MLTPFFLFYFCDCEIQQEQDFLMGMGIVIGDKALLGKGTGNLHLNLSRPFTFFEVHRGREAAE